MDILGFALIAENPMEPDQTWVQLGPKGGEASISLVTWFDSMKPGSVQGLVIMTDNLIDTRDALIARGATVGDIDETPWGMFASVKDPDGNGLVLHQT